MRKRASLVFALLGAGCVDADHLPPSRIAAPGPARSEIVLPNGARFEGCPAGAVLRGYPAAREADAAYCVTEIEPARRQGPYLRFYPSGKLLAKGWYLDGNPDGAWATYHENGQRLSEGFYLRGIRDGAWKFTREDGKVALEEVLSGGARVSWVEYVYEKGVFRESDSFVLDSAGRPVLNGPSKSVRDGAAVLAGSFQQGKGQGLWEEKTPRGDVVVRLSMAAGFAAGSVEVYWPETGKLAAQGQLVKTLPQGAWKLYYPSGEPRAELTYEKGLLRSIKAYHKNGKERMSGEFLEGAPHALWASHREDGSIETSGAYSRGARAGMWRTADSSGKPVAEGLYTDGLLTEGQPVEPLLWSSLGLKESLGSLFSDLAYITAGHGKVESEQRAIAECMLVGDPAEKCYSLDWESFPAFHANDGPPEIERRDRQQELACAMNNPAACARIGARLASEVASAKDPKKAALAVAGYHQKACDLSPNEVAWKARDAVGRSMSKGFHSGVACVWLGEMLDRGEVKSKALSAADLYKRACDMQIEQGCQAAEKAKLAPKGPVAGPPKGPVAGSSKGPVAGPPKGPAPAAPKPGK